jgi:type II secretory pathway pseudopilin PulG
LLVVIAIMIVSVAIIIPSVNKFAQMTRDSTAKNGLNTALSAIRAYATREIGQRNSAASSDYSGVAIIVTPASELRLVENDQFAQDTQSPHVYLEDTYNGYIDIEDRDYITLPKDTGLVGIATPTGLTQFISPPFAIRFDANGQLAVTDSSVPSSYVYYDGNYDGYITLSGAGSSRSATFDGSNYKVQEWDPSQTEYVDNGGTGNNPGKYLPSNDEDDNYGKYRLPFEKLDAVIGVITYSKRTLKENCNGSTTWPGTSSGTAWPTPSSGCGRQHDQSCADFKEWLQDNGEVVFFSRYTGNLLQHK